MVTKQNKKQWQGSDFKFPLVPSGSYFILLKVYWN